MITARIWPLFIYNSWLKDFVNYVCVLEIVILLGYGIFSLLVFTNLNMQQGSSIPSWLLNEAVQSMKMINLQQLHVPSITLGQSVQCMLTFSCIISLKASQDWLLQIASNNVSWRSPGNQKLFNACENHIYIEYWMEDCAWGASILSLMTYARRTMLLAMQSWYS